MARKSFIQINGVLYDKSLPLPEGVEYSGHRRSLAPAIISDTEAFVSPIDNTVVRGRAAMREHCAKHDVVPTADLAGLPPKPANKPYEPDRAAIRETIRQQVYK